MKKFIFVFLFFLFTSISISQVLYGKRWRLAPQDTLDAIPSSGFFISNRGNTDSLFYYQNGVRRVLYPQSGGAGGSFITTLTDSGGRWITVSKSNDTLYVTSIDSLSNVYQNVWKRTTAGYVDLVNPADSIWIGGPTVYNSYFPSGKLNVYLRHNSGTYGIVFPSDSGVIDVGYFIGRLFNNKKWLFKTQSSTESLQWQVVTPPSTTNTFLSQNQYGWGFNTDATSTGSLVRIAGNLDVGNHSFATPAGSGNLRAVGLVSAGYGSATVTNRHYFAESTPAIFEFSSGDPTDSVQFFHDMLIAGRSTFTSASLQTIITDPVSPACVYQYEMTALVNPVPGDTSYYTKRLYCTARIISGTVVLDTTTAFVHTRGSEMTATANFVATISGNNVLFQVAGSASQATNVTVSGWRKYLKDQ